MQNREIKTISDELVFQRDYYDEKYPDTKFTFDKNYRNFDTDLCERVGAKYTELTGIKLARTKTDYPKGFSFEVLYNIEQNNLVKDKKGLYEENHPHNKVQTLDNYYLIMFCMFKVYGFLDDYDTFKILEKYDIKPKNEIMFKKVEKLREKCLDDYQTHNSKSPISLIDENSLSTIYYKHYNFLNYNIQKIPKTYTRNFLNINIPIDQNNLKTIFNEIKEIMFDKFKSLSYLERKCTSLDLGKETCFIDDLLNNRIEFITIENMLNILKYLDLGNSDIYYIIELISRLYKTSPNDELNIFEKKLKRH